MRTGVNWPSMAAAACTARAEVTPVETHHGCDRRGAVRHRPSQWATAPTGGVGPRPGSAAARPLPLSRSLAPDRQAGQAPGLSGSRASASISARASPRGAQATHGSAGRRAYDQVGHQAQFVQRLEHTHMHEAAWPAGAEDPGGARKTGAAARPLGASGATVVRVGLQRAACQEQGGSGRWRRRRPPVCGTTSGPAPCGRLCVAESVKVLDPPCT
jgi:hypothetical protein